MSALPPKADSSFYEHTDFRPSLISIATVIKRPANPLIFCTRRPPKADIGSTCQDVRFVPQADMGRYHSITSFAI
jgi:hypothetical protein